MRLELRSPITIRRADVVWGAPADRANAASVEARERASRTATTAERALIVAATEVARLDDGRINTDFGLPIIVAEFVAPAIYREAPNATSDRSDERPRRLMTILREWPWA
jgi:hypothetical protein